MPDPHRSIRAAVLRRAALASAAIVLYLALARIALEPLKEAGAAEPLTAPACGLAYLIDAPGRAVLALGGYRAGRHPSAAVWLGSLAVNGAAYFALALPIFASTLRGLAASPSMRGRRRFLRRVTLGLVGGGGVVGAYSLLLEPRWIQVARRTFPLRGLPPALAGLRVVHFTDVHHGPWISIGQVREAVRVANSLEPDVIALTGDYVYRSGVYIEPVVEALADLRAKVGIVGVLGNHDWYEGGPALQRAFAGAGIPLIDNARLIVTPERKLVSDTHFLSGGEASGLCLAGVGDLWEDAVRVDRALGGVPESMPRLLLSHNPDVAELRQLVRNGPLVDLMLSGHTHGGQVWVPGFGTPVVPSKYGQKYAHGLVQGPACPVLISSGIGMTVLPVRFGVPPEVGVIELAAA